MKLAYKLLAITLFTFAGVFAQEGPSYVGTISSMQYVPSIQSRLSELPAFENVVKEAEDGRSSRQKVIPGKDAQTQDDFYFRNQDPMKGKLQGKTPSIVFDAYQSGSQPTDPSIGVGLNHVIVVFNTGFRIFDKDGNPLTGQLPPNPSIFPSGGCCDLTVSYDSAADRWILTFLGGGAQIAVSDGPDPLTSGWNVYTINQINDYQKLSVWSDGYYITDNTGSSNKVWALERDEMLAGNPTAQILGFNLPGIATSGFYSPQALNVTDDNMPATGAATIVYLQDDAWAGVSEDHVKYWNIDVDWGNPGNSTVSNAVEITTTPFISVFDGGSFSNLTQPGGGIPIDALQATIMNQAQFRKFPSHNSAVFNFVVDVDATSGEHAAVRWYEFRQTGDGQPWTIHQEGTYTAPDAKHAWHASLMMDYQGNIGMGYSGMTIDPNDPDPVRVSSYYTGRFANDPLNTMTIAEELIANGNANIPGLRYGDYSKIDIDPANDKEFWFINEYINSGRKGVVGVFQIAPNFNQDIGAVSLDTPVDGILTANEDVTITIFNYGLDNVSNFDVSYQIDGGTVVTETFAGTVNSAETAQYTFATQADLSNVGQTYEFVISTNLAGDEDNANDSVTVEVTHLQPDDIGVIDFISPVSGTNLSDTEDVTVEINNFGGASQSNFDVSYTLNGDTVTETVVGPLDGNSSMMYTFSQTADLSAFGIYNLSATTSLPGDSDTSNDELAVTVTNSNCQPTADCSLGDGFQLFSLTTINNPSACEGYGDFTDQLANVDPGNTYDLTVTTGWGDQFVTVWIDYNDDFVFTPDEKVVEDWVIAPGQGAGSYTETTDFVLPSDAPIGLHLMRAKSNWNAPVPDDACEETTYGETEDYIANVGSLGINDLFGGSELMVVNKGNNLFEIRFETTQYQDKLELRLHNILGQQIFNRRLENEGGVYSYELDLSYVAKGVYLVHLGNKQSGTVKKIIVQ